jgi:hypothetical protein
VRAEPHARGEVAPHTVSEGRQNGAGRKPRPEGAPKKEAAKHPHHEDERIFETVATVSEQPAPPSEARVEDQSEPEAPRRRGWWQR